jgi:hypothetical protein
MLMVMEEEAMRVVILIAMAGTMVTRMEVEQTRI